MLKIACDRRNVGLISTYTDDDYVASVMLHEGDWCIWQCSKSKRQADGTVVREFRAGGQYFQKSDGGFRVTSRDAVVTGMEPLE